MPEQVSVVKVIARSTQMHHTKAVWDESYSGFVLLPGEIGFEVNNDENKVIGMKVGLGGTDSWVQLPYFGLKLGTGTDSIMQANLDPERANTVAGDYSAAFGSRNFIDTNASESSAFGGIINIYSENSFGAGYRVFIFRNQNFAGGYVIGSNATESILWGNTINVDCTPVYESNKIKRFTRSSEQEERGSNDLSKYLAVFGEGHNIGYAVTKSLFSGNRHSVGYDCKYLTLSGDQHSVGNHCSWITMFGGNGNAVDDYTSDTTIIGFSGKVYHDSRIDTTVLDKIFMIGHNINLYSCTDVYSIGHHNEFDTSISKYYETPRTDMYCIGPNNIFRDVDNVYSLGSNNHFYSGGSAQTFEQIYNIGHNNEISTRRTNIYMFGYGLIPTKDDQWTIGKYNATTSNSALFVIGNGDNASSRRNPYLFYDNKYTVSGSTVRSPELGIGNLWLSDTYISTEGKDFSPGTHGKYVWDFGKDNNFDNNNSNPYIDHSTLFCFGCKIGNHVTYINVFGGDTNNIGDYTEDSTIFGYWNSIPAGTSSLKNNNIYMFGNHLTAGRNNNQWIFGHDNATDADAILLVGNGTHTSQHVISGVNVFAIYADHVMFPTYTTVGDYGATTKFVNDNYVAKNTAITGAQKCKITYDAKGLVTAGEDLSATDIPNLDAAKINSGVFDITRIPTGTGASQVALGNHTHTLELAVDTGAPTITLAHDGTYKLTAGGSSIVFKMPSGVSANQKVKAGSTTFNDNAVVDIVAGSNVTVTGATTGTGAPKITISATDTTYNEATGSEAGLMPAVDKTKLDACIELDGGNYYLKAGNVRTKIADIVAQIRCFREDTSYVTMYDGTTKLISEVKPGDSVLGYDVNKQEYCEAIVISNDRTGEVTTFDCYVFEDGTTVDIDGVDSFLTHFLSNFEGLKPDSTDCFNVSPIDYLYNDSRERNRYFRKVIKSTGGKDNGVAVIYKSKCNCAAPTGRYRIQTSNGTCFINGLCHARKPIDTVINFTTGNATFTPKIREAFANIFARQAVRDPFLPDDHIEDISSAGLLKELTANNATISVNKEYLNSTDYKAMKYAEGALSEEEWLPVKARRIAAREEINAKEQRNTEILPLLKATNPNLMNTYDDKYWWVKKIERAMLDFDVLNGLLEDFREYMNSLNNQ